MASGYVSWTTPDGNTPNPVYIDDRNKSVEFSAREDVAPYTITRPIGSAIYTLSNLGVINGFQCYKYIVFTEATTTTTTTTTEPPEITLSTTGTCIGGALEGSGRIVASGFSGGSGTYSTIRIGTSMEEAFDATPILLSGATSYQFDNLNSAVWHVLVTDSAGYQGYARQIINCTNTTTTAPTTSTTTEASTTTTTSTSTTSTSTTTTTGAPISFNLAYDASSGPTACSNYPATNTALRYSYYDATLGNGIQLFTSNTLGTPVANGYYSNGANYWLASGGILNSQVSCSPPCAFNGGTAVWTAPPTTTTTTTTTTAPPPPPPTTAPPPPPPTTAPPPPPPTTAPPPPPPTTAPPPPPPTTAPPPPPPTTAPPPPPPTTSGFTNLAFTYSNISEADACEKWADPMNRIGYYGGPGATYANGTTIYNESSLSTVAVNGYYSNGTNSWLIAASAGIINNQTSCSPPPPPPTTAPPPPPPTTAPPPPPPTTAAPAYNYYTLTSCTGGEIGTDYRSTLSLGLNQVYTFQPTPPVRACYQITDINAAENTNDLPTLYGPLLSGCADTYCQQL